MPFEDELGDALHRTGDSFAAVDHQDLVAGGVTRGRRSMVRRRAAAVGGSVLALAVVAAGGAYGGGLFGSEGAGADVAASPVTVDERVPPVGDGTSQDIIKTLRWLLPPGELTGTTARGIDDEPGPMVSGVFDDGKGKAAVGVSFFRVMPGNNGFSECPDRAHVPYDACTAETLADGSRLVVLQGYEYPDKREETKDWRATLLTKDGLVVDVSESNAPAEKGAEVSRTDPPLTPAQLKKLVTAAQWKPVLAGLARQSQGEGEGAAAPGNAGIDGAAVRTTLVSLLPDGLEVTDEGVQQSEYAYVVADDGKGGSLVEINVQRDMRDVEAELFPAGTFTTLPDGTKVRSVEQPAEKGGEGVVEWSVDTIRPDGRRVVLSAYNAAAHHQAATRDDPALTMDQLKSIATSEKWTELG
ncbi:hypothetical protein [Streptomyces sp. FIT100]|uniref:hypothetical protein n=1 Tax=Streptomyces sp. FIT100 TaxID=2837956 RepID=UPI0021C7B946|nr:hypothetical protein [Streptomyces sp. FIT100]UUN28358.1 hypothetical protein KK483_19730 [Streptomyces sp. FIT100]